jgi:hypothetical protein
MVVAVYDGAYSDRGRGVPPAIAAARAIDTPAAMRASIM